MGIYRRPRLALGTGYVGLGMLLMVASPGASWALGTEGAESPYSQYANVNFSMQATGAALNAQMARFNPAICAASGPATGGAGSPELWSGIFDGAVRGATGLISGAASGLACPQAAVTDLGATAVSAIGTARGTTVAACPDPQFDEGADLSCDMFRDGEGAGFNEDRWAQVACQVAQSKAATDCRVRAAEDAVKQMNCIKGQLEALKNSMDGMRRLVEQQLDGQRQYVAAIDAEVTRFEEQAQALDGLVGERGALPAQMQALQAVIAANESQIPVCAQRVREFQQSQRLYDQAIARAVTERGASCFLSGKPAGMAIGQCTLRGTIPSTMIDFLMCRYEISLYGTPNPSRVVLANAQNRTRVLRERLTRELGGMFSGDGSVSEGTAARAVTGRSETDFKALLDAVISQAGASPAMASQLRNLQRQCFHEAEHNVRTEVAATGSSAHEWRTRMENQGLGLLAGGESGPCGNAGLRGMARSYGDTIRTAATALYGRDPGAAFDVDSCTSMSSISNTGSAATFNNANLNRGVNCVQAMQNIASGLVNGTPIGGRAQAPIQLPVPVTPAISCTGLRDCITQGTQRIGAIRNQVAQMNGDGTFPNSACPSGCPGRKKFIRTASQGLRNAIQGASDQFSDLSTQMRQQVNGLNGVLSSLGLSPMQLQSYDGSAADWQCPANEPEYSQLCETPTDMAALLGSRAQPPTFDLASAPGEITNMITQVNEERTRRQGESRNYNQLVQRVNGLRNQCRREDAIAQAQDLENALSDLVAQCSSDAVDHDVVCNSDDMAELSSSMHDIERALGGDRESARSSRSLHGRFTEYTRLCGRTRSVTDYQNGANYCSRSNEENATIARIIALCGSRSGGRGTREAAESAAEARRRAGDSSIVREEQSADGTATAYCIVPCTGVGCPTGTGGGELASTGGTGDSSTGTGDGDTDSRGGGGRGADGRTIASDGGRDSETDVSIIEEGGGGGGGGRDDGGRPRGETRDYVTDRTRGFRPLGNNLYANDTNGAVMDCRSVSDAAFASRGVSACQPLAIAGATCGSAAAPMACQPVPGRSSGRAPASGCPDGSWIAVPDAPGVWYCNHSRARARRR